MQQDQQQDQTQELRPIVPTRISFQRGGTLEMTKDRAVYRDGQLISPAGNVVDHSVELDLQPSGYDIRLHPASNGVLHVEPDGTLRSVLGKSNLPYLPQETVATFLGRIELADGSSITFDHKGR